MKGPRIITYIAWDGNFSSIIETIDSSADWSAIVIGPASESSKYDWNNKTKDLMWQLSLNMPRTIILSLEVYKSRERKELQFAILSLQTKQ